MEEIRGVVERITYADEDKGYSVIKVAVKGYSELVTVVGNMASVSVGTVITAGGEWTLNPKYGRQFNAASWEESVPATTYGIEKYLGSGLIKGIGPKYAKLIVGKFGDKTIEIIEESPDKLIDVPGIGSKRVAMIKRAWQEQREVRNIMVFLQEYGVSTAFGYRIYKAYGNDSITKVKSNPYQMADDIWGVGFKTADTVAMKLGIDKESYDRCRSGVFYVLNRFADEGHCYAYFNDLVAKSVEMLEIEESKIVTTVEHLHNQKELFKEADDAIYLPPFYYAEIGTARRLNAIMSCAYRSSIPNADMLLDRLQRADGIEYDEVQIEAVKMAVSSKVFILTGGPGTGKTTITKAIIRLFEQSGKKVLLAAPTGRAAKRMSETCGMEAKTIHRLLESKPPEGFGRDEENPLEGDVLILDEASMIDILLMYNLLKAVPDSMTVIFVGDIDQLPPVGAGNVLRDAIDSEAIPVMRLTRIFRQAAGSLIITNAHKINKGIMPNLKGGKQSDFFFSEYENPTDIAAQIVELCANRLPRYYGVDAVTDIQVLTPMRRGETGSDNLNRILQTALNKNTLSLRRGATEYKLGDKVMQIKNNYDKQIYNGDIGCICDVDTIDKTLSVDFDGVIIEYDILELDELVLSYAVTIHKSQGGEFPIVVMPFSFSHYVMLCRNLLYTGVTRAKKAAVMLGESKAVAYAVRNNDAVKRNTMLADRLKENSSQLQREYIRD